MENENPAIPAATAGGTVQRQVLSSDAASLAVQPVSCPELGPAVVAYLKYKLQGSSLDLPADAVHRERDHQGVWHIFNRPPPEGQAPPVRLAAASLTVPAVAHAPPLGQTLAPLAGGPQFFGPSSSPVDSGSVITRRDPRGVLHVSNCAAPTPAFSQAGLANFLGKIPPDLQACIIEAAQLYRLPVPLILALIRNESNFVAQAISPKGAMGLMQLMPGTASSLGVKEPFDPRENILAGCRYFRFLLDYFQGSVPLAVAGYNAGCQRVVRSGYQVPAIKETQEFVTQVMGLYYLLEKHISILSQPG
jgi:Transglycosylase SLT domain